MKDKVYADAPQLIHELKEKIHAVIDEILGWQRSHLVFFHDFQSKFINTNNKHKSIMY